MRLGAIEAGGTKFVVAVGDEHGHLFERSVFPTTTPEKTMQKVFDFFDRQQIEALGVGTFGPIDPDKSSPTYGYITTTPKAHWSNYNMLGDLRNRYPIPIGFDTDVNGAALGELYFGSCQGLDSCLYLTIGTGIGGGAVVEGKLVHGLLHPEMGHIKLVRHPEDSYQGRCPYHKDCLEGLASGPAIEERWGQKGHLLPLDHPAWDLEAYYIAQALTTFILTISPKKIVLGGGVMKQRQLFPMIHHYTLDFLNGYVQKKQLLDSTEQYIIYPQLGDDAGICGALALAKMALEEK